MLTNRKVEKELQYYNFLLTFLFFPKIVKKEKYYHNRLNYFKVQVLFSETRNFFFFENNDNYV